MMPTLPSIRSPANADVGGTSRSLSSVALAEPKPRSEQSVLSALSAPTSASGQPATANKAAGTPTLQRTQSPASLLSGKLGASTTYSAATSWFASALGSGAASLAAGEGAKAAPAQAQPGSPAYVLMEKALAASARRAGSEPMPPELDRLWRAYVRESLSEDQIDMLSRIGATDRFGAPLRPVALPPAMQSAFSLGARSVLARFGIIKSGVTIT